MRTLRRLAHSPAPTSWRAELLTAAVLLGALGAHLVG